MWVAVYKGMVSGFLIPQIIKKSFEDHQNDLFLFVNKNIIKY